MAVATKNMTTQSECTHSSYHKRHHSLCLSKTQYPACKGAINLVTVDNAPHVCSYERRRSSAVMFRHKALATQRHRDCKHERLSTNNSEQKKEKQWGGEDGELRSRRWGGGGTWPAYEKPVSSSSSSSSSSRTFIPPPAHN